MLTSGSLVDAIRGSIAIPYIFAPHAVGERLLVDGYLSDPMPVGVAIKEGADIIIAMGFDSPYQSRVNSLFRYTFQISSIMANNLFNKNFPFIQRYAAGSGVVCQQMRPRAAAVSPQAAALLTKDSSASKDIFISIIRV